MVWSWDYLAIKPGAIAKESLFARTMTCNLSITNDDDQPIANWASAFCFWK
jgi:hypothetical protein